MGGSEVGRLAPDACEFSVAQLSYLGLPNHVHQVEEALLGAALFRRYVGRSLRKSAIWFPNDALRQPTGHAQFVAATTTTSATSSSSSDRSLLSRLAY